MVRRTILPAAMSGSRKIQRIESRVKQPPNRSVIDSCNKTRQAIKVLVCILCGIGFVYQTAQFMVLYFTYPIVVDSQIKSPQKVPMPAITFCNNNFVRRNSYCSRFPHQCEKRDDLKYLCTHLPYICKNDMMYPIFDNVYKTDGLSVKEMKALSPTENGLVLGCAYFGFSPMKNCSIKYTYFGTQDVYAKYHNCYRTTFLEGEELMPTVTKNALFTIYVGFEQEEYLSHKTPVFLQTAVHEPYSLVSPFSTGFEIKPLKIYDFYLKLQENKLLPSPYETNCTDYIELWMAKGKQGPTTQWMCMEECKKKISYQRCNCSFSNFLLFDDDIRCENDGTYFCLTETDVESCAAACPQACHSYSFSVDVKERKPAKDPSLDEDIMERKQGTLAAIYVWTSTMDLTVVAQRPQYQSLEILSYIGGYIGIWLGVSLVAVFNFMEAMMISLPSAFRKKKKEKIRQKRIAEVKRIRRIQIY